MIKLIPFVLGNIALLIQQYADHYQQEDLSKSLTEVCPILLSIISIRRRMNKLILFSLASTWAYLGYEILISSSSEGVLRAV